MFFSLVTGMDSVISRLRSTVSSALPGNQVSREFDLEEQVGSSGPGLLWKLYSATKRSSKEVHLVCHKQLTF